FPVSMETVKIAKGSAAEFRSEIASHLPSADHANELMGISAMPIDGRGIAKVSAICLSGPPRDGFRITAALPPPRSRRNAIKVPSGDQAGLYSFLGSVDTRWGG